MANKVFLVLLVFYILLYAVNSTSYPSSSSFGQIFPQFGQFKSAYQIIKVDTNSDSILVHSVRHSHHQLWYHSSLSSVLVVYKSNTSFCFASTNDTVLMVTSKEIIYLYKQPNQTWKVKQIIQHVSSPNNISVTRDAKTAIITTSNGLIALFKMNETEYFMQPMTMDNLKLDFGIYPRSLLPEHNIMVTGVPMFRQTDGVVDIYHFQHQDMDLYNVNLIQTITPPVRAGYFGGHVVTASFNRINKIPVILVSAPFANNGAGSLYLYTRPDKDGMFRAGQTIQANAPIEQLGRVFDLSPNSQFLAVSTLTSILLFQFNTKTDAFEHVHGFPHTESSGILSVHVDNTGRVMYATPQKVIVCKNN